MQSPLCSFQRTFWDFPSDWHLHLIGQVSYPAARNEGRWEFVEQKASFQQGVQLLVGICPSEKGNRVFQEEAAGKRCTYKEHMLLETVNGCDWFGGQTVCVCVCVYKMCMYTCLYICGCHICEKIRGVLERRMGKYEGLREFGLDSAGKES